jgi:folate-dependent phosphoribosylglycinamide formyltransferase PurN
MIRQFIEPSDTSTQAAIFLSGSGSNAEKILETIAHSPDTQLSISVLVTDRPKTSRAVELGDAFNVPVVGVDIRTFYRSRGQKRISIKTPEGRTIREEWTNEVRRQLAAYQVDFGIFAGFVPLCNLAGDFPCLNVHPGDLTYEVDGNRHLVGLHTIPVELAILQDLDYMRSSVIIAEPYEGKGENMDAGHILGISPKVTIDLQGYTLESLKEIASCRPERRPPKGYCDLLEAVASHNQELLKVGGDWVLFPPVVQAFAHGRFGTDDKGTLNFEQETWTPVSTVEFDGVNQTPHLVKN